MRPNDEFTFESASTSRALSRSYSRGTRHEAVHAACPRSSTATILTPGTCTLSATQAGNTNHNAAATFVASSTISKIAQTIAAFTPVSPQTLAAGGRLCE